METEIRFYFPESKYENLVEKMSNYHDLSYEGCFHELTIQYDHPMKEKSFYSAEIDGRFRVRISKEENSGNSKAKISWKQRTQNTFKSSVNNENEIEVNFSYDDFNNLSILLEKVINMEKVESYERYRNVFSNEDVEIVIDKYPFGIALEIENKSKIKNAEEIVLGWAEKLGFDFKDAFRLSWDDKYTQLCREQNVEIYKNVVFGEKMPEVID